MKLSAAISILKRQIGSLMSQNASRSNFPHTRLSSTFYSYFFSSVSPYFWMATFQTKCQEMAPEITELTIDVFGVTFWMPELASYSFYIFHYFFGKLVQY